MVFSIVHESTVTGTGANYDLAAGITTVGSLSHPDGPSTITQFKITIGNNANPLAINPPGALRVVVYKDLTTDEYLVDEVITENERESFTFVTRPIPINDDSTYTIAISSDNASDDDVYVNVIAYDLSKTNVTAISGDSTAADNMEDDYDGTGYDKANSTIGTTTVNADMRGTNLAATSAEISTVDGKVDTINTNVSTLLTRITSSLFTGITSLSEWLGLIAGKQVGDTTARTELRATGVGSGTYDETTDSIESLRDYVPTRFDALHNFNPGSDTVAQVQNVAVNSDMRGTDGAITSLAGLSTFDPATQEVIIGKIKSTSLTDKHGENAEIFFNNASITTTQTVGDVGSGGGGGGGNTFSIISLQSTASPTNNLGDKVILQMFKSVNNNFTFNIVDAGGNAVDLTSKNLRFIVYTQSTTPVAQFKIEQNDMVLADVSTGIIVVPVTDTQSNITAGTYSFLLLNTTDNLQLSHGDFVVLPSITDT